MENFVKVYSNKQMINYDMSMSPGDYICINGQWDNKKQALNSINVELLLSDSQLKAIHNVVFGMDWNELFDLRKRWGIHLIDILYTHPQLFIDVEMEHLFSSFNSDNTKKENEDSYNNNKNDYISEERKQQLTAINADKIDVNDIDDIDNGNDSFNILANTLNKSPSLDSLIESTTQLPLWKVCLFSFYLYNF